MVYVPIHHCTCNKKKPISWNLVLVLRLQFTEMQVTVFPLIFLSTSTLAPHGPYEPKMVAHICFMFRIYLELHLKLLSKQLKVLKRVRLSV